MRNLGVVRAVGVDIESIARFRALDRRADRAFFRRVFTPAEIAYCFSRRDPAPHLAARFCAKEAVVKALCSMGRDVVAYRTIEVLRDGRGVPSVRLRNMSRPPQLSVSVSHCRAYAIAVVVATA